MAEDFLAEGRARWLAAIEHSFGPAPSSREVPGSPQAVLETLQPFIGRGLSHAHFSSGGGHDMEAGAIGVEPGTIDLIPSEKIAYRMKAARLAFHYIEDAPGESFLFLELAALAPSGIYPSPHGNMEEVVDLGRGNYFDRSI